MKAALAPITLDDAATVGRFFGLSLVSLRPDLNLAGSPERSAARCGVMDAGGRAFVIERLVADTYAAKVRIADTLAALAALGLKQLITYLADVRGEHVVRYDNNLWQIAPFVSGVALPRPDWVFEGWRGVALGDFLLDLRTASLQLVAVHQAPAFDLVSYILTLVETIRANQPLLILSLAPILACLTPFFESYAALPTAFCHGDYHPLNVIWGADELRAVIDWEFCGPKPALYDLANLIGCAGIEEPAGLTGALVRQLLLTVGAGRLDTQGWRWLPELTLALRFAWLSEWLRQDDQEMIEMELCYMALLACRRDDLRDQWLAWADERPAAW